jgi:hypothetical protein
MTESGAKTHDERLAEEKVWLVKKGNEVGKLARDVNDWKNQIGVLQAAAAKETEPLVMSNLLRYQAARNDKSWKAAYPALAPAIEECSTRASKDPALAMLLIRHLLLYSSRAYIFERWQEKGAKA